LTVDEERAAAAATSAVISIQLLLETSLKKMVTLVWLYIFHGTKGVVTSEIKLK